MCPVHDYALQLFIVFQVGMHQISSLAMVCPQVRGSVPC